MEDGSPCCRKGMLLVQLAVVPVRVDLVVELGCFLQQFPHSVWICLAAIHEGAELPQHEWPVVKVRRELVAQLPGSLARLERWLESIEKQALTLSLC